MISVKKDDKMHKLTEPQILNVFLSSLKSLYKQQESKKKNYKKLINSFSIRVQKYEDSSSNADTRGEFKLKKTEKLFLSCYSRRKKNNDIKTTEYSHNSDSSIYNKENNIENQKIIEHRTKHSSINRNLQFEKMKFLKHKFCKQIDQKSSKRFLMETENFNNNNGSLKSPNYPKGENNNIIDDFTVKNLEINKDMIYFDSEKYECDSNNNNCSFSLDQKSKIIYVKDTSPNELIFNSKISSYKTTKINDTPASNLMIDDESYEIKDEEDNSEQQKNLDHEEVIEKLKNIEKLRKKKKDKSNNNSSSDCN